MYYGKSNVFVTRALCSSCGAPGELTSYDTTLYVTVVYVPIIPLGRKRVIDT